MDNFTNFHPENVWAALMRIKAKQDGVENVEIIVREVERADKDKEAKAS